MTPLDRNNVYQSLKGLCTATRLFSRQPLHADFAEPEPRCAALLVFNYSLANDCCNAGFLCYLHLTGKFCLNFAANPLILAIMSPSSWHTRLAQFLEFPLYNFIQLHTTSEDSTPECSTSDWSNYMEKLNVEEWVLIIINKKLHIQTGRRA